jgi:hypothetical protein
MDDSLLNAFFPLEGVAKVIMGFCKIGLDFQSLLIMNYSSLNLPTGCEGFSEIFMSRHKFRLNL